MVPVIVPFDCPEATAAIVRIKAATIGNRVLLGLARTIK